MLAIV